MAVQINSHLKMIPISKRLTTTPFIKGKNRMT